MPTAAGSSVFQGAGGSAQRCDPPPSPLRTYTCAEQVPGHWRTASSCLTSSTRSQPPTRSSPVLLRRCVGHKHPCYVDSTSGSILVAEKIRVDTQAHPTITKQMCLTHHPIVPFRICAQVVSDFEQDGCIYLELRTTPKVRRCPPFSPSWSPSALREEGSALLLPLQLLGCCWVA